ncbi:MAG: PAS domain S-box protein [Anaerolineales bacterium]
MKPSFWGKLFTLPNFSDENENHQANLLHTILWALTIVPIPYLLFTFITQPDNLTRAFTQAFFGELINFFLLFLLRKRYIKTASYLQIGSLWLFFTISAITGSGGGVRGEAYLLGYPLVIVITGTLLGEKTALAVAVLSLFSGGIMTWAESRGVLITKFSDAPLTTWAISLALFPLGAILQYLSARTVQKALARAQASEERYKLISRVSSDYVFETIIDENTNNNLSWVGGAFEKMTGYTYEEYQAAGSWVAHVHPEDREQDEKDMAALSSNQDIKSDIRTITKNGDIRWERISAHPIWDYEKNKLAGIVGAVQDVTETKQAESILKETLIRQSAILNNIPDMAWLKDANGYYIAVNEPFSKVAGLPIEQIIGKTDFEIWGAEFAKEYRADDIYVTQTKKRRHVEEKQQDSTGKEYWVETVKTPILNENGDVIGTTGIARDISERKQAELLEQRRRTALEKVVILGKYVTEAGDLKATIKKIWHGVHDELGYDRLAIFLYNSERNSMDDTIGTNSYGQMQENWEIWYPIGENTTFSHLLEKPDGLYFTHNYDEENNIQESHEMYGVKDFVSVAAWAGDKPVAVICADNFLTKRPITDEQLEALRLFAGYAGLAFENAHLHETLQNELTQQKLLEEGERKRRAILEKVIKLGQYVTASDNFLKTLDTIWKSTRFDLDFDRTAIFLYDSANQIINGSLGTDKQGEMTQEWDTHYSLKENNDPGVNPFIYILDKPESIYQTHDFETEYNIPPGNIMSGVKDFASVPAWAGDKLVAVICVDQSISGRKITYEQLEALRLFAGYAGLAIENTRLSNALQNELTLRKDFIEELEAKNAELERFTYTVSHDLKSPLVTIIGFLGYLEIDARAGEFEKLQKDINRIRSAAEKMQNLLRDLLELSRIGRIINTPTEIPFSDIVKEALEIVQGQIKTGNVFVEFHDHNVMVFGDQVRLVEVLQNLIDNAVKFMGNQSVPHIEINSFVNNVNETVFVVKDNGIGIEKDYHEKIFGLFNKLDTHTNGTGIGLTLVKRIIEVHGGQIWLDSEKGKGTTFYFTLAKPQSQSTTP